MLYKGQSVQLDYKKERGVCIIVITLSVAKDYSDTPGGRYITDGPYSGEDFRETVLLPKYEEAVKLGEKLLIDLDGTFGYPSSFRDEAFGGLAKIKGAEAVLRVLEFVSLDQPSLIRDIEKDIRDSSI